MQASTYNTTPAPATPAPHRGLATPALGAWALCALVLVSHAAAPAPATTSLYAPVAATAVTSTAIPTAHLPVRGPQQPPAAVRSVAAAAAAGPSAGFHADSGVQQGVSQVDTLPSTVGSMVLALAAFFAGVLGARLTQPKPAVALMSVTSDKPEPDTPPTPMGPTIGRRGSMGAMLGLMASGALAPEMAFARSRISLDDYSRTPEFLWRGQPHEGVLYYNLKEGSGKALAPGTAARVTVNFECKFKSIIAVSSRSAVTLAQNRTLEKPYSFNYGSLPVSYTVPEPTTEVIGTGILADRDPIVDGLFVVKIELGSPGRDSGLQLFDRLLEVDGTNINKLNKEQVRKLLSKPAGESVSLKIARLQKNSDDDLIVETTVPSASFQKLLPQRRKEDYVEAAGGMFSGEDLAPPPAVMFLPEAFAGMKKGGIRRINVTPELGYGLDGKNEIPAGADFTFEVEIEDIA